MKTVLVTGFNGFIGLHLIPELQKNFNIIGISLLKNPQIKIKQIKCDISKINERSIPKKISTIIHLAAISDVDLCQKNPLKAYTINVQGTQQILEIARKNDAKVIFLSTGHVFGDVKSSIKEIYNKNPTSIYAATKLEGEKLCESYANSYGLDISIPRLFSVYGPNSPKYSVTYNIIQQLLTKQSIRLGNLETKRDFIYIKDSIEAILLIMKKIHGFNDYNIGTGKSTSIIQICNILKKISVLNTK